MDKKKFIQNTEKILKNAGKKGRDAMLREIILGVVTLAVGVITKKSGGK